MSKRKREKKEFTPNKKVKTVKYIPFIHGSGYERSGAGGICQVNRVVFIPRTREIIKLFQKIQKKSSDFVIKNKFDSVGGQFDDDKYVLYDIPNFVFDKNETEKLLKFVTLFGNDYDFKIFNQEELLEEEEILKYACVNEEDLLNGYVGDLFDFLID